MAKKDSPSIEDMIRIMGKVCMIRIEQWRQEPFHWRVGVNWYSEDDYEFVCEKPKLYDCIEEAFAYTDGRRDKNYSRQEK